MSILDRFDFAGGNLPPWVQNLVDVTRPFVTALVIAIPAFGGAAVGTVAFFSPTRANAMAAASALFFQGIPDVAWGAIATIAVGYFGAKTMEQVKGKPAPLGRRAPEEAAPTPDETEARIEAAAVVAGSGGETEIME